MATAQTDVESQTIELSTEAFDAFCEDISGMFSIDMQCSQQQSCTETIKGLQKRFKKLAAVNSVKSEGALGGNFRIVFDKEGLFTLAGIIVMQPEQKILDNIKQGSAKDAEDISDAVGEAGNLFVGSWDKIFREGLEGHGHFVQTNSFIGNPWDNPEEKIGLSSDEEFLFVPYEMTIGSYPAFNCGVIFPKTIFSETSVSDDKTTAAPEDEKSQEEPQEEPKNSQDAAEKDDSEEPDATGKNNSKKSKSQPPAAEKAVETGDETAEQTIETDQKTSGENQAEAEEPPAQQAENTAEQSSEASTKTNADNTDTAASDNADELEQLETAEPAEETEPATGPVSETIQKMAQSSTGLPGAAGLKSLAMSAKDIMQKDVLWANADDSIQQALTKMQQADVGYMMVGTDGQLDGIVSTFDIAAALSVYLKPMFAKWRRPIDDATLQIKIKWIMTRPVHTIKPDTLLTEIMENMRQSGLRCLPVVDQQGSTVGLVTVFDIFNKLLNTNSGLSTAGKTPQAPSLA